MTACPRCALGDHDRTRREDGVRHRATEKAPRLPTLQRWVSDGVAEATDGCIVEPDGRCEHGHVSWLLQLGLI